MSQIEAFYEEHIASRLGLNSKRLDTNMRLWMYETLGFRAELGSLSEGLPSMVKSLEGRGRSGKKKAEILGHIQVESLRAGENFSDALKQMVPEDEFHIISAAETSGNLAGGLFKAVKLLEQKEHNNKAIHSVLQELAIRFSMLVGVTWFLGISLFPPLAKMKPVEQWPEMPQVLYRASTSIEVWLPILVLVIASMTFAIMWSLKHLPNNQYREFAMRYLQPWSIHRDMTCTFVLDSFNSLSVSLSEKAAVGLLLQRSQSIWLTECLTMMKDRLRTGDGNILLNNPLLPDELNDVLASMGDGGSKQEFYIRSIDRLQKQTNARMEVLKKRISTIGTLLLYTVLGCMVLSYFQVSLSAIS